MKNRALAALKNLLRSPLVALALASLAPTATALAEDAEGPLVDAIFDRFNKSVAGTDLREQYFQTVETTRPQWTPDGGAFWIGHGYLGRGAIYARMKAFQVGGLHPVAHVVYGGIFEYWALLGYEANLGYPTEEERDGDFPCEEVYGPTLRQQQFTGQGKYPYTICWGDWGVGALEGGYVE